MIFETVFGPSSNRFLAEIENTGNILRLNGTETLWRAM